MLIEYRQNWWLKSATIINNNIIIIIFSLYIEPLSGVQDVQTVMIESLDHKVVSESRQLTGPDYDEIKVEPRTDGTLEKVYPQTKSSGQESRKSNTHHEYFYLAETSTQKDTENISEVISKLIIHCSIIIMIVYNICMWRGF